MALSGILLIPAGVTLRTARESVSGALEIATGDEFATVCGLVALGRCFGEGDRLLLGSGLQDRSTVSWQARLAVRSGRQIP
jgi:hypothetical protein